ncbi:type IV toxin-antitoxin system AbiEi family antitoxin domain-containing protein [Infirmifilum lucidum]|uniref:Type IV toxin-antitoxin system AbiEi family antitoxin domain-containing protein n=1 Tax=Infirmifilum lucidum TaxID=2776706 RepID=A0A7L9FI52_9CREN|nr:type IV toxin-antitoxin system AbiEi family antitoxin domain-containing protein [Infirmifilum lucidum]QOJ78703.1 type IV toxin-antitoxin system AbiEi family antitoxin domain-containing protein [Infirmifilum lucidum]
MKYVGKIRKYFNRPDKPVFSYYEVLALNIPSGYAKLLLHNMVRRGEIIRLRKGWYSFHRDPLAFIYTLPPHTAYYGLGFAAYMHGAWVQVPNPEILTYAAPRKIRTGIHVVLETPVIVHGIARKLFGSYTLVRHNHWLLPISTPEKTLADMLYFDYPFLDEVLDELIARINVGELRKIIAEYPYPERVKRRLKTVIKQIS